MLLLHQCIGSMLRNKGGRCCLGGCCHHHSSCQQQDAQSYRDTAPAPAAIADADVAPGSPKKQPAECMSAVDTSILTEQGACADTGHALCTGKRPHMGVKAAMTMGHPSSVLICGVRASSVAQGAQPAHMNASSSFYRFVSGLCCESPPMPRQLDRNMLAAAYAPWV
jgi:hypothetical protein